MFTQQAFAALDQDIWNKWFKKLWPGKLKQACRVKQNLNHFSRGFTRYTQSYAWFQTILTRLAKVQQETSKRQVVQITFDPASFRRFPGQICFWTICLNDYMTRQASTKLLLNQELQCHHYYYYYCDYHYHLLLLLGLLPRRLLLLLLLLLPMRTW